MGSTTLVLLRLLAAIGGGYALTAATVPLAALLLAAAGMARSEATTLAMMLGFIFYALLLLWAFSVGSLSRLWTVLAGSTAVTTGALLLLN
ncbi:MAG: hypothetical protein M3Q12_00580 [Pseudomonadota bacterium]|uniref:hypothetical protein n=1 Tax=Polaromonas sp. TaxID=1869339 RepID=UPI00179C390A|nr:hypothetical protein [Polaromonas sp.]MBA3595148.1 hypothetical protein [Polaromonas sp.]MDQ3270650.1 hypothetical protein [Pseudomonadota bacterium]